MFFVVGITDVASIIKYYSVFEKQKKNKKKTATGSVIIGMDGVVIAMAYVTGGGVIGIIVVMSYLKES